jgi:hypothetical protein
MKKGGDRNDQMLQIIQAVNQNELTVNAKMLDDLGIRPIWYDGHEQVPAILQSILPE